MSACQILRCSRPGARLNRGCETVENGDLGRANPGGGRGLVLALVAGRECVSNIKMLPAWRPVKQGM